MELWATAALAILVGTVLQRVSGTGVGLVCAPILALLLGSAQGVLVTNATTTMSGFLIALSVRRDIDWRRAGLVIASAAPGALAGAFLVRELSAAWLQVVIGAVVVLALVTSVALPRLPHWGGRLTTVVAGAIGGVFNTTAGVAAPVMVVYSRLARIEQKTFAATLQPIFMAMGAMSVVFKSALAPSIGELPPVWFLPIVLLTVALGIVLGGRLAGRVSAGQARALALLLAGLGGATTLVRGILALVG